MASQSDTRRSLREALTCFICLSLTAACGLGESEPVELALTISSRPCPGGLPCGTRSKVEGLVAPALDANDSDGRLILYGDTRTASGALAVLEVSVDPSGAARFLYYELSGESFSFRARVDAQDAQIERVPGRSTLVGSFRLQAADDQGSQSERWVWGEIQPISAADPPPASQRSVSSGATVHVFVPIYPAPREPPPVTDSGCEGDAADSGCDDGSSSAGCEDEPTSSGCDDSSASAGCDDSSASAGCDGGGSSDGCSADASSSSCTTAPPQKSTRRALLGTWRLLWPVVLVRLFQLHARHQRRTKVVPVSKS